MVELNDDQARARGWALPQPIHVANEGLAFLLELVMLAGLAWWGSQAVSGIAGRITLAILTPGLAAVIWGLLAAPRARLKLPLPGVLAVKAVLFGGASVAVYSMGQHALAIGFAVVAAVNTSVAAMDRQALMATRAGLAGSCSRPRQAGSLSAPARKFVGGCFPGVLAGSSRWGERLPACRVACGAGRCRPVAPGWRAVMGARAWGHVVPGARLAGGARLGGA